MDKTFIDLPYTVVFEVLKFHFFGISKVESNSEITEFEMFGYFSRDPSRVIYQLFENLKLTDCDSLLFYPEKIRTLKIAGDIYDRDLQHVACRGDKFTNLKELIIKPLERENDEDEEILSIKNLFSKKGCFPEMKSLYLKPYMDHSENSDTKYIKDWTTESPVWTKLETLELNFPAFLSFITNNVKNSTYFASEGLRYLKELTIREVLSFDSDKRIYLLSIEKIELHECCHIFFVPGVNLKRIHSEDTDFRTLQSLYSNSLNLESFFVTNSKYEGDDNTDICRFLFETEKNTLETFQVGGIVFPESFPNDSDCFSRISQHMEYLEISHSCKNFKDLYLTIDFPKLSTFHLSNMSSFKGDLHYSLLETVDTIQFYNLYNLTDRLFRDHDMKNLSELTITKCHNVKGLGWNTFPKLTTLNLKKLSSMHDIITSRKHYDWRKVFPVLQSRKASKCPLIYGGYMLSSELSNYENEEESEDDEESEEESDDEVHKIEEMIGRINEENELRFKDLKNGIEKGIDEAVRVNMGRLIDSKISRFNSLEDKINEKLNIIITKSMEDQNSKVDAIDFSFIVLVMFVFGVFLAKIL